MKSDPVAIKNLIYTAFNHYKNDESKETMVLLQIIARNTVFSKLTKNNIDAFFSLLEEILLKSSFKRELTEREKSFLSDIKQLAEMFLTYSLYEIYFKEKVNYHGQEYIINVERTQEGGFYGEIPAIDGCYTEGNTISELKANILEVLAMYSEEELATA